MMLVAGVLGQACGGQFLPICDDRREILRLQSGEVVHQRQRASFGVRGLDAVAQDQVRGLGASAFAQADRETLEHRAVDAVILHPAEVAADRQRVHAAEQVGRAAVGELEGRRVPFFGGQFG